MAKKRPKEEDYYEEESFFRPKRWHIAIIGVAIIGIIVWGLFEAGVFGGNKQTVNFSNEGTQTSETVTNPYAPEDVRGGEAIYSSLNEEREPEVFVREEPRASGGNTVVRMSADEVYENKDSSGSEVPNATSESVENKEPQKEEVKKEEKPQGLWNKIKSVIGLGEKEKDTPKTPEENNEKESSGPPSGPQPKSIEND